MRKPMIGGGASLTKDECAALAARFEAFDPNRKDPFKKIHWKTISDWQNDGVEIVSESDFALVLKTTTRTRAIQDFSYSNVATIAQGERECLAFCYDGPSARQKLVTALRSIAKKNGLWLTCVNQENADATFVPNTLKSLHVSSKVSGVGADIWGLHYVGARKIPPINPFQRVNFFKLPVPLDVPRDCVERLLAMDFAVTDRGERYGGKKKSWRRVCLRAAGDARTSVESDLGKHPVMKTCPSLLDTLRTLSPLNQLDAIMLTRVDAEEGVIVRHTDIALDKVGTDTRFGITSGKTLRLHLVLQSNPRCTFHIWDLSGVKRSLVMKTGDIYYTDIRKPHAVDNEGDVARLHLVVDVFVNNTLKQHLGLT